MTRSIVFFLGRRLPFTFFCVFAFTVLSFGQNAIVIENGNPGNPVSEWSVPDFRDNRIAGFSTKMSLNRGQTVRFKINVQSGVTYTLRIYRLGYYQGNGARLMQNLGTLTGTVQPNGISDPVTGLLDCSNWSESASWNIPATAVSGLYIAKLERSGGGSNHIAFIVRNDASNSDLYLQFPDARWQAYNGYGGNSMYDGNTSYPNGHAVKASYNRPFFPYNSLFNIDGRGADWYMNNEYPMIRWLERNGYDVTYTGSNDIARNPGRLYNHRVFISIGHDEYWSKEQRDNIEAARNGGVHLAFFSGNEVYWKTRWESNDGTEDRTLVCYKEGLLGNGGLGERTCGNKCDVSSPQWTGLWRTGANYDAGEPENALTGQISWTEYPGEIRVPSNFKKIRFWRNTSIPNLSTGQSVALGENTLGYEWDYEQPEYASNNPQGRFTLSSTTVSGLTHKLSLYRHSSGALVFGAGTVQWSWGLDGSHWGGSSVISADMQQATVNLFADMGVQAGSLQAGLTQTTQSTDFTSPTSTITSPSNNGSFLSGSTIVISGTATDGGGGVVAGMEISVNGGITWNSVDVGAADGSINWSYTWVTGGDGTFNIKTRGVDDSGNNENPGTGINIVVGPVDNTAPTVTSVSPTNGSTGVGIGTNVTANFNEAINGSTVTGTTFQLRTGGNLVSATVSTSSNQLTLTPNAALTPSTTYTVTITGGASGVKDMAGNALVSNYSWSFTTSASTTVCPCNIFLTTTVPASPLNNDGQGIELGVRFRTTQNGFITGIRYYKGSGTTGTHIGHLWSNTGTMLAAATFTNETASGWQQVLFSSPVAVTAGVTYVASQYSPSGHYPSTLDYFTQAVVNGPLRGLADGEDGLNGVYTYSAASAFPVFSHQSSNYWVDVVFTSTSSTDNTPPTVTSVSPLNGATGVSINAIVTANFSEAVNSSTVTGTTFQLRDAGNNLVTSTVNTASGQITLTPSAALAGSTVYTVTIQGGASGVKDLAGNALANNYSWSFTTASVDNTAPTVTSVSPTNGSTGVGIGTNVTANFNEAINGSTVTGTTFQLRTGGNLVSATVSTSSNQLTLTPNAALTPSTTYTVTITGGASGVKDLAGNALATNYSWSFTTIAVDNIPPVVSNVSPVNGSTGVSIGTTVSANFNEAINASTVTGTTVQLKNAANVVISAVLGTSSNVVTLTPSVALTNSTVFTVTILGGASGVKDLSGNALASNYSWTFTTAAASGPITIFQPTDIPLSTRSNDGQAIEVGVKFRSTQNGFITGIRYYKGLGTTGIHLGNLWSRTGTRLAQATFTNETASGWQQVLFANPVAITAGVTYVASYFSPSGDFAATNPYFAQAVVNGPLRGLANGEDGPNGLWNYTPTSAFPANGYQTSNYWADVVFVPNATSPTVTTHPASQTVCAGTNVSFTSAANGDPAPTVQWQSTINGTDWTNVSGATTGTLTFGATAGDNNKQYRAVWSNSGATVNSNPATLTVNAIPAAPTVTVANNCGNSVLTASGFTGSLLWSNGATTTAITVTTAGTYTVRQTVNSCISPTGSGIAAPVTSTVAAPIVNVVNNCGNSVLTASGFTGTLLWSNGATTPSITVTTAATYTVTQSVGVCTSPAGSGVAAPKATPALTSSLTATFASGAAFIYIPSSTVTGTTYTWTRAAVAGISNPAANGTGNISEALINTTSSPINVTYAYSLTASGCTNNQNVVITINPLTTVNCTISNTSLTANFNSTSIPAGRYIWFNSSFDPATLPTGTDPVTMNITNSVISFTANSVQYTLNVPDARVRFDATVTSASTQFVNNVWETVVPRSFTSYVFMGGLSYQVPVNFPGNIANVRWTTNISFDKVGISVAWRWSAAVYAIFAGHAGVNVKPISGNTQNPYLNSDRAGTPENYKLNVVAGARGNGGTNYTGNYVNTGSITCSTTGTRSSSAESLITNATKQIFGRQLPEGSIISLVKRELEAVVMPNPSSTFFTLSVKGSIESPVTVRIVDIFGQEVERHERIAANSVLQVGHKLSSGSYFAEVTQGNQRKIVRIIKAR